MKLSKLIKYSLRFLTLQIILTFLTIYYFDNVLISNLDFKQAIYKNLLDDAIRFLPNLNPDWISVDIFSNLKM